MSLLFLVFVLCTPSEPVCQPRVVWHSADYVWQNITACGCGEAAKEQAVLLAEQAVDGYCEFKGWQDTPVCCEDANNPQAHSCCCVAVVHCPLLTPTT